MGLDGFLGLLLGADEQHLPALGSGFANEVVRFLDLAQGALQVDDVDPVALREDVRAHLGVPSARLVSEMDTCFQQALH